MVVGKGAQMEREGRFPPRYSSSSGCRGVSDKVRAEADNARGEDAHASFCRTGTLFKSFRPR